MTDFAARISRVRLKNGADVHVLHNLMPNTIDGIEENWQGKMIRHARSISEMGQREAPLDGFIVIGLFSDGAASIGFRLPDRIPPCLVPGYVTELLRRDVIVSQEAARTFDNKFEWVET